MAALIHCLKGGWLSLAPPGRRQAWLSVDRDSGTGTQQSAVELCCFGGAPLSRREKFHVRWVNPPKPPPLPLAPNIRAFPCPVFALDSTVRTLNPLWDN